MKKRLPALLVIVFATSAAVSAQEKPPPPPPPAPPPQVEIVKFTPPIIVKDKEMKTFYKRNPAVAGIDFTDGQQVIVRKKNGTKENYDLNDATQKQDFIKKYGALPEPPPPPPAPPKPKMID